MNTDIEKLNKIARDFNDKERARMADRKANRYWRCASSAVANKIFRRLRCLNLSISDLALKLNMDELEVIGMLDGKTNFDLKTLIAIERAIGVHIIDQEVIPQSSTANEVIVKVEYKISIPAEANHTICSDERGNEFTTIDDTLGKSENLRIYG